MYKVKTFARKIINKYNWDNITKVNKDENYNNFNANLSNELFKNTDSEGLLKSLVETDIINQNDIDFSVNLLLNNNLSKKEIPINNDTSVSYKSPFLPPIDPLLLIHDNFNNTHRLILNKFPLVRNHLLVTTKELIDQNSHLEIQDIEAMILIINFLKGLAFFFVFDIISIFYI